MLCLDHTITKKMREPSFAAEWDSLEPEEQIVRAIIEGREERHLTQNQLADATGIHQTNISKLESGTANPSLRTLKRLAAGWECGSSWNLFRCSQEPDKIGQSGKVPLSA